MNIIHIRYRTTNYYILDNGSYRLLIDAGWPGSLGEFKHALQVKGFKLADIDFILVTHYHPDHAGLTQDIKNTGAKLMVMHVQQAYIPLLKTKVKPNTNFIDIADSNNIVISISNSRAFLQTIGFNGEVLHTPSHSDDSITLVLDSGDTFIGDLQPGCISGEDDSPAQKDWHALQGIGVKKIYPGHAAPFSLV